MISLQIHHIRKILKEKYQMPDAKIRNFNKGFNAIFEVTCRDKKFLFKTYDRRRIQKLLSSEKSFHGWGISVMLPLLTQSGEKFVELGDGTVGVLYPFVEGTCYVKRSKKNMKAFGQILGRLHSAGYAHHTKNNDRKNFRQEIEEVKKELLKISKMSKDSFLRTCIARKLSLIDVYHGDLVKLKSPKYNCFLHGDYHERNIIFTRSDFYMIDFEYARYGSLELEIARSLMHICFGGEYSTRTYRYSKIFLQGYREFGPDISKEAIVGCLRFYFLNNILRDCGREKMLVQGIKNHVTMYTIYRKSMKDLHFLSKNLEVFLQKIGNQLC